MHALDNKLMVLIVFFFGTRNKWQYEFTLSDINVTSISSNRVFRYEKSR